MMIKVVISSTIYTLVMKKNPFLALKSHGFNSTLLSHLGCAISAPPCSVVSQRLN